MDNLKKLNFTELDSSEMKQVQGGGRILLAIRSVDESLDLSLNDGIRVVENVDRAVDTSVINYLDSIPLTKRLNVSGSVIDLL
ncbi:hypothetical protein SD960_09790 [Flavobacterium sp. MMLR14_040]|uniref:hypothetical protein n=1 Tax=Flavobacterium sp. MMLR14_040 TaxID=3093843 RepID=UPI00298F58FE|nr:hypothetical protein [Flavobacterium sp. MMLR14_040]MDW8850381.1 hypothetical protein [Flavobacterium sp. MMLR14_040]